MKRVLFPILIGLGGLAVLLYLGTWQVQRLGWKQDLLANIEERIASEPVALPAAFDPDADRYLPVTVQGRFLPSIKARMLASRRHTGAVHRNIAIFETDAGRRILVDIGWTKTASPLSGLETKQVTLVGNLDWPRESDEFTPEPDLEKGLWYARDVARMAEASDTEVVLLVLRDTPTQDFGAVPWPVDTAGIPNDHLQYAITWFSLALVWVAMTALFTRRTRRGTKES